MREHVERSPSPEVVFMRNHKASQHTRDLKASKQGKDAEEPVDPQVGRPIRGGMWDPTFNLGHKIDFHFDEAKRKVIEGTSEQKMTEICMELACRMAAAAWTLAYASNRANLKTELEKAKAQLNEVATVHSRCEQK